MVGPTQDATELPGLTVAEVRIDSSMSIPTQEKHYLDFTRALLSLEESENVKRRRHFVGRAFVQTLTNLSISNEKELYLRTTYEYLHANNRAKFDERRQILYDSTLDEHQRQRAQSEPWTVPTTGDEVGGEDGPAAGASPGLPPNDVVENLDPSPHLTNDQPPTVITQESEREELGIAGASSVNPRSSANESAPGPVRGPDGSRGASLPGPSSPSLNSDPPEASAGARKMGEMSDAVTTPSEVGAGLVDIVSGTHIRHSATYNESLYSDTVRVMLLLPESKAALQHSPYKVTRLVEMIAYIGGPACIIKLQTSMIKIMGSTGNWNGPRNIHNQPAESFDAAGEILDDDAPDIIRNLKDRWIDVRSGYSEDNPLWKSVRSMLAAWQLYSYWEETKRIYHSEDGQYAEEQAYFQRIIARSGHRPRGRKSDDDLKRAISPFFGISQMTAKKDNIWCYSIKVGKLVSVFNNCWGLLPLLVKTTLLDIGNKLLEAAIPVLLARHPSLEHLQQVIFTNYVGPLWNGGSLPLRCRTFTVSRFDATTLGDKCNESPLGLLGLFGYRSLAEAGLEMPAGNALMPTLTRRPNPLPSTSSPQVPAVGTVTTPPRSYQQPLTPPDSRRTAKPNTTRSSVDHGPVSRSPTGEAIKSPHWSFPDFVTKHISVPVTTRRKHAWRRQSTTAHRIMLIAFTRQYGIDWETFRSMDAMQQLAKLDVLQGRLALEWKNALVISVAELSDREEFDATDEQEGRPFEVPPSPLPSDDGGSREASNNGSDDSDDFIDATTAVASIKRHSPSDDLYTADDDVPSDTPSKRPRKD
ncbi:MAG: hypothetical protein Q9196_006020 [Gyalolechia fulgens]